ncbi:MAG: helix-turn-helix domain-containing protein [Mycoplasmataceae bacterium]|jgi:IS30 family transposase|nr:helix-turn-helix domain-containing protein [Mycoplasmataceae bacterium]
MNNKNYKHISHDERILIVDDFNNGLSIFQIARKRNRNKTTISRMLKSLFNG